MKWHQKMGLVLFGAGLTVRQIRQMLWIPPKIQPILFRIKIRLMLVFELCMCY